MGQTQALYIIPLSLPLFNFELGALILSLTTTYNGWTQKLVGDMLWLVVSYPGYISNNFNLINADACRPLFTGWYEP